MNNRLKLAFAGYALVVLVVWIFGVVYLFRPEFMPYHSDAVGMVWQDVPQGYKILILALMKTLGGAELALGLAALYILIYPFRRGENWAKYALPAISLVYALPSLYVTLSVRAETAAEPPWMAIVIAIILVLVSFILSLRRD